ncbi:condensin complex subunit 2-like isoform X2 [Cornus florida]|uniref:condensin complex subunit 2-like isoform X2 n=1 Tax=Cornus florida TaxID=4283 RepID=UPI00289BFC74|nr:condensin complex subunit 2-like isoform X2 [Cornus florida]
MATRLQSPTSPFFLGSNNDQLERAQARAARAAAVRRKAMTASTTISPSVPCLGREQIIELFHNCIKLASENKINQKNTWELKLIDHLSEVIKVETENNSETNFQKASCTLEAGVKIYSMRVDSVHSEAYKVLGRISWAGGEDEEETVVEGDSINNGQDEGGSKNGLDRKISPLSTLEPSYEALNVKKFEVAFAVDPLYRQTSAQFDEGGAKGLLLNNLGIYGGCRVLFDSLEVPNNCVSCVFQNDTSDTIDIFFAREYIEQMVMSMPAKNEISPTLGDIVSQFDEDNKRPSHAFNEDQTSFCRVDSIDDSNAELDSNSFGNYEAMTFDHDEETNVLDESFNFGDTTSLSHDEEDDPYIPFEPDVDGTSEKVAMFLFQGLGFTSEQNAWAGPDYWKYRKTKGLEDVTARRSKSGFITKKPKNNKATELDIDFMKALEKEMPNIFAPPKNVKLISLPPNRVPWGNILPEDCHYQPEDLVKLFLLPNVMCFGKRRRLSDKARQKSNGFSETLPSWDNENMYGGQYDDGCIHSDLEDSASLVSQPRQVNKIEVQYDKTSKQVDVHVLKETLWDHIQESIKVPDMVCKDTTSFRHVLATFPDDCQAAAPEYISPHLCFICLLHLANEHCLSICDCPTLDDLSICLPYTEEMI